MVTTLAVPCFRYLGKELFATLTIEQDAQGKSVALCPLRESFYSLRPEEHVRQALVWFLVEGANSAAPWKAQLRFLVERSSLDVSAYHGRERRVPGFAPPIPVVIFETKRIERDSEDDKATDEQLQGYMVRERCRSGFIFNGRQAAWMTLDGAFTSPNWTKTTITDLQEAESRITQSAESIALRIAEHEKQFALATDGDFDALKILVEEFGIDAGLTFYLSVRSNGQIGPARAFSLKAKTAELITYRARAAGVKHRLELSRGNFHALRSIEPLVV